MRSVMAVEDDDSIRLVLRVAIEDLGYQVTEAASAEETIDLLHALEPDLLLVDRRLPGRRMVAGLASEADDCITTPFVSA